MKTNDRLIDLVKKVKGGNNAAFTDLYNESYKYLHTCVIHIVKDEDAAQDMLQDAYVEIYKNIGQLKDDAGFLGWAATIANRKCFAYLKKNKDLLVDEQTDDEGNETDYFDVIADDEAFIPENILDNQEKIKIIRGIIDDLTDIQRACVIGFYYNEQKQDEIANELGLPVNTVKSHLNRAKAKIKEAVGDTERKQGIKLYSIAPFMLLFFLKDTEVYAAELSVPAMSAGLSSAVSGSTAAGSTVATGAKAAGMAIKTKVIAGIVAGAVVVGGISGVAVVKNHRVEVEDTEKFLEEKNVDTSKNDEMEAALSEEADVEETKIDDNEHGEPLPVPTEEEIAEYEREALEQERMAEEQSAETSEPTEMDEVEEPETNTENSDADALGIMTGRVNVDQLIGRGDTMGWSKIKDISDVVNWGSTLYSESGKTIEVICCDKNGDEIGMIETTEYTLGSGTWDGPCYYTGTEYENHAFRVVVFDASDEMGPNSVWVQFYPVME